MILGAFELELATEIVAVSCCITVTVALSIAVLAGPELGFAPFLLSLLPTPPPTAALTTRTVVSVAKRKKLDLCKPHSRSSFFLDGLLAVPFPAKIFPLTCLELSVSRGGCSTSSPSPDIL